MTAAALDPDDATGIIMEYGCPICGADAGSISVRFLSAIELFPCGHIVFPEDARDMKRFYQELWFAELHQE